MFEKLLSLVPYNPGMSQQLAFYGRRMRQEAAIRRTGVIVLLLAFTVQFFAVLSPPQSTSAASTNDLINGGFGSAAEAARDCNSNVQGYAGILNYYGITCGEVANSPVVTIQSTDHNRQLYSMGRKPYGLKGETPINVNGATYYMRYLWSWDTGGPSSYKALRILNQNGTLYYLLFGCGNLTSVGLPQPYSPPSPPQTKLPVIGITTPIPTATPPQLTINKTTSQGYPTNGSSVAPGASLGYRIDIGNTGGSAASNVDLSDPVPANTSFVWQSQNAGATVHSYDAGTNRAHWQWSSISKNNVGNYTVNVTVKINANTPNGTQICNVGHITASGLGTTNSNQVCMTVVVPSTPPTCPYNAGILLSSPSCFAPCPYNTAIPVTSAACVDSNTPIQTPPTPTPTVCQYNSAISSTDSACVPCQYNGSIAASDSECKPCQASLSSTDTSACVTVHKTASNVTAGISDANNTTANPGNVILYTLYADNTGKATVKGYNFSENLSDVLIYANATDLHGGSIDSSGDVSWPAVDIAPGQTATEQVSVTVKNPVPNTPANPSDPGEYDLTMTNVYGNAINIKVPGSTTKSIETTSASLPNTGPGAGLFIGAVVVMVAGYFYGRARLLAKESLLAAQETTTI